nr:MAG TPA: hypothetical protein [Caudoviricetes sp.]
MLQVLHRRREFASLINNQEDPHLHFIHMDSLPSI